MREMNEVYAAANKDTRAPAPALSHDDAKAYQEATLTQYPSLIGWYARWWQSHQRGLRSVFGDGYDAFRAACMEQNAHYGWPYSREYFPVKPAAIGCGRPLVLAEGFLDFESLNLP